MLNIQAVKDSFYITLQNRIATLNPARMVVVRGLLRPGVLVAENELPGAAVDGIALAECFYLRWTTLAADSQSAGLLLTLGCEIRYASDGSIGNSSIDRGRALTAMDVELASALTSWPQNAALSEFAEGAGGGVSTSQGLGSNIFWTEASFGSQTARGERVERSVELEVRGYGQ